MFQTDICNEHQAKNYTSSQGQHVSMNFHTIQTAPGNREGNFNRGFQARQIRKTQETNELNRPVLTNATLAPSPLAAAVTTAAADTHTS